MASDKITVFQKLYNIWFSKSATKDIDKIYPAKVSKNDKTGKFDITREKLPTLMQYYWDYFVKKCHNNPENLQNRFQRYKDMDQAFYNGGLIFRATKLVVDEVVQSDSHRQPLMVEAPKKQKDFLLEFFDKINIYSLLRDTAMNIVKYGDAGWGLSLNDRGVEEILPVKVFNILDRIEFTPQEISAELNKTGSQLNKLSGMFRVDQLIKSVMETESYASYLKSYLFGFQISDLLMPPWRFLHFRNFTSESPFFPFGMPLFLTALAPYSQYDAALTLQIAARGASFPREIFNVQIPNVVNGTEKMEMLAEFINMIENIGISKVQKEGQGIGERVYTVDGVYSYSIEESKVDLGKMEDAEMLREDMIAALGIPRNYIDPSDGGFGDSGVALAQKFKPFARMVFAIQQVLLEQISQLCKIHMIQSNAFPLEEIDFRLSMPYPEEMTDRDAIANQSDQIRLAQDLIQTLSNLLLAGDAMPDDITKNILHKILPYSDTDMNKWFKLITKHKKSLDADGDNYLKPDERINPNAEVQPLDTVMERSQEKWLQLEKRMGKRELEEAIEEKVFSFKQKHMKEGVLHGAHYYSSNNKNRDFNANFLREVKKKKLAEIKDKRQDITEEVKYVFKSDKKDENEKRDAK